jgi:hypothetical protein
MPSPTWGCWKDKLLRLNWRTLNDGGQTTIKFNGLYK